MFSKLAFAFNTNIMKILSDQKASFILGLKLAAIKLLN
jgi:hypothetical protein